MNLHISEEKKAFDMWLTHAPLGSYLTQYSQEIYSISGREHNMPMGLCYQNALFLATEYPERYTYFEGLAFHYIPMWHAWLYDHENEQFVDPTWGAHEHLYLGTPFALADLNVHLEETNLYGFYDNHHIMRWTRNNPERIVEVMENGQHAFNHKINGPMSTLAL